MQTELSHSLTCFQLIFRQAEWLRYYYEVVLLEFRFLLHGTFSDFHLLITRYVIWCDMIEKWIKTLCIVVCYNATSPYFCLKMRRNYLTLSCYILFYIISSYLEPPFRLFLPSARQIARTDICMRSTREGQMRCDEQWDGKHAHKMKGIVAFL